MKVLFHTTIPATMKHSVFLRHHSLIVYGNEVKCCKENFLKA